MAHNVETMAYAGETPWHGLGTKVSNDLTPVQMMGQAGLDWTVEKYEAFVDVNGDRIPTGQQALVRSSDNSILTNVGENWNPVQNEEAFEFFAKYCAAGDMEMHTAGSLQDGKIVWVLAKINESFDVLGSDRVDSYLLFSNPHQYGKAIDVRFTPIRVVCNNTLTWSLNAASKNEVKLNHRSAFNPDMVAEQLGIAHNKFSQYREMAEFLSQKRYTADSLIQYYNQVFPHGGKEVRGVKDYSELSTRAKQAFANLETQPGAEYGEGTWWSALNSVTYTTDHQLGRSTSARLQSAWYGYMRGRKQVAVNQAIDFAEAA